MKIPAEPEPQFLKQHERLKKQEARILALAVRLVRHGRASKTVRRVLVDAANHSRYANGGNGTDDTVRMVSKKMGLSQTQENRLREILDEEDGDGGTDGESRKQVE